MMQRAAPVALAATAYEDMPLSVVLFRYLWPFWLFKDAARGDRLMRAAAYRHNRSMRVYLPGYLCRWMLSATIAFALTAVLGAHSAGETGDMFSVMAALSGIAFACSLCVLFVTGYVYAYLQRHES
jgi:hypothetical protein